MFAIHHSEEAWIHRAVESMGLNAQVHKEVVAVAN